MVKNRWLLVAVVFVAVGYSMMFTGVARAEYPEREITIINMAKPGLTTDILVRALIIGMSDYLGKPIVVEYKDGSSGMLAASVVATAKPDGYTLCSVTGAALIEGALMRKTPYKPLKDFTPISAFALSEHTATLVAPDAPWKTFQEFVDYSKKNPGKIKMACPFGSGMHIAMEFVAHQEGINWVKVPYGSQPGRTAVMGHNVDVVTSGSGWQPFVESGQLRVLVTHGRARTPQTPNVPTLIDLGYDFAGAVPQTLIGPAGLPPEVVSRLEAAVVKGMETAEFKAAVKKSYTSHYYLNAKDYAKHLRERWTTYEHIFKEFGIIKQAATQPE